MLEGFFFVKRPIFEGSSEGVHLMKECGHRICPGEVTTLLTNGYMGSYA